MIKFQLHTQSRKVRHTIVVGLAIVLLVCGVSGCSQEVKKDSDGVPLGLNQGQRPPALVATDLEGNRYSAASHEGQKVMISFWTTWCTYCIRETPAVKDLYTMYDDLEVIAVNVGESKETVQTHVELNKINYTVLLDPNRNLHRSYQITGFPTKFFLNSDGTIHSKRVGALTLEQMQAIYEEMY